MVKVVIGDRHIRDLEFQISRMCPFIVICRNFGDINMLVTDYLSVISTCIIIKLFLLRKIIYITGVYWLFT